MVAVQEPVLTEKLCSDLSIQEEELLPMLESLAQLQLLIYSHHYKSVFLTITGQLANLELH